MNDQFVVTMLLSTVLSALVALNGKNRSIGYMWSFMLCFFLSPIIGWLIIRRSKKIESVNFYDVKNENQ